MRVPKALALIGVSVDTVVARAIRAFSRYQELDHRRKAIGISDSVWEAMNAAAPRDYCLTTNESLQRQIQDWFIHGRHVTPEERLKAYIERRLS